MNPPAARRKLRLVRARLVKAFGPRPWRSSGTGVGELVATILSQNTSAANASAGYRQLWRRFRSWPAVANAPEAEIERRIRVSGLSNIKAPRIKAILNQIKSGDESGGRLSLEFLRDWPVDAAYRYLLAFDGVGPKTAACVLLFAFGMPIFPVDTHIVRIAIRLGLLPQGTSAEAAQELLTPWIAPADWHEMHLLLIELGRKICRARNPKCEFCPLLDICKTGKRHAKP